MAGIDWNRACGRHLLIAAFVVLSLLKLLMLPVMCAFATSRDPDFS